MNRTNRLSGLGVVMAAGSLLVGATLVGCTTGVEDPSVSDNVGGASSSESVASTAEALTYTQDFFDGFDGTSLNSANWQPQVLWVNNEGQCYDNNFNINGGNKTLEVSNGSLKLRVVDSGVVSNCDNWDKYGAKHPNTRYKGGRITSKNRKEFARGRFTARLKLYSWMTNNTYGAASGQANMFPAWWLLGYRNNENPVQQGDENVCWPLAGSGEIDIFEHYGSGGANAFTARVIKNNGSCNNGDWSTFQIGIGTDLSQYHEFQVDYAENDVIYRVDNQERGRNYGQSGNYGEPMQMILNYAINGGGMAAGYKEYAMDVDWVKHESASSGGGGTIGNGNYEIKNVLSGKSMDVTGVGGGANTADGANVQVWSYGGGNNQKFTVTDVGSGQYSIKAVHSGKGLDVTGVGGGANTADGANVQQWSYGGGNNQKFTIVDAGGGQYNIKPVHSGKCVEVAGNSTADGANVQQWGCVGSNSQKWTFTAR